MVSFAVALAYLLGGIPFGVIIAKRRGVDIRKEGSGNIGATNVTRVMGLGAGALVLLLDALKGFAAVALAEHFVGIDFVAAAAGFAAIFGHCFSPFLNGKGGKGVATALGVFAAIAPPLALVGVAVFLAVAGRTRVPALGSLAGMLVATAYAFGARMPQSTCILALASSVLLVYTHRGNLARVFTTPS